MEMLLLKLSAKEMVDLAPAYEGCKSTRVQHQTGVGNRVPRSPWSAPCGVFAYPQIQRFQYLFVSVPDTSIAETLCSRREPQVTSGRPGRSPGNCQTNRANRLLRSAPRLLGPLRWGA